MMSLRRLLVAAILGMMAWAAVPETASATEWGRFYHYPHSYTPYNYRRPFRSQDFSTNPHGYPYYPQYMAFPPYFRTDLYYPYFHGHNVPGGTRNSRYQGNHFILDVF